MPRVISHGLCSILSGSSAWKCLMTVERLGPLRNSPVIICTKMLIPADGELTGAPRRSNLAHTLGRNRRPGAKGGMC